MRTTCAIITVLSLWSAHASGQPAEVDQGAPPSTQGAATPAPTPSPPVDPVDAARQAFISGTDLAREGRWNEALVEFERSSALRPHPVTTYNVAYVERALGRYTRARRSFRWALAQIEPEPLPPDLASETRAYLQEVESKIAHVTVTMVKPSPLTIDGKPLEAEATTNATILVAGTRDAGAAESPPRATFELLVDPGSHVIVIGAKGSGEVSVTRRVEAGAREQWSLPAPGDARSQTPARTAPMPDRAQSEQGGLPTWALVAYGVGATGLIVGTTFGLLAMGEAADLEEECGADKVCDWEQRDTVERFNLHADLANVGFAVAFAGAALGTFLLLSEPKQSPSGRVGAVTLRARVGVGSVGLLGRF